jgi:Putative Flp pilus-assembly TadE/G-like
VNTLTARVIFGQRNRQRGSALFTVAVALIAFIGLMGLAIDLVSLYLGKSEAQRAADAAALAGATVFVSSGCTSNSAGCGAAQTAATTQALTVGKLNLVGGATPTIPNGNVSFDLSHAGDPLITVVVNATMPTYFMKLFGVTSANVSSTATAEAFNPSGTANGPTFCVSCLKPFLVPNCDPNHAAPANGSCAAGGNSGGAFINANGSIANPGVAPAGIIGQSWQLHTSQGPSHWFEVAFDCSQSGSAFQAAVKTCDNSAFNCGSQLCLLDGKKVGPNNHAVCSLIGYTNSNSQDCTSVDSISVNAANTPPFTITAGAGNPFFASGSTITQSASVVTVPVFDGGATNPGNATVTIVGYLQLFIQGINHNGKDDFITATIMNASSCGKGGGSCGTGGSGQGTGGAVSGGGSGFIPVRLVHP